LPRYGFYTTPAFLALWNTNDSNQHRVTANQALLVALGQAFTAENTITPFSTAGLDANHAVAGSECVGLSRDAGSDAPVLGEPARLQRPQRLPGGQPQQPRQPAADRHAGRRVRVRRRPRDRVQASADFGDYLGPGRPTGPGLPRFGISVVQQLCFYANSAPCSETDSEFRRVVDRLQGHQLQLRVLLKEFFSSPLVTGAAATGTYAAGEVPVSIARRDHLCAALSNRLGKADLCSQAVALPSSAQSGTARIAASVAADAFSRGAQSPVTPADPNMFYRAATEMLCENIATQVVDGDHRRRLHQRRHPGRDQRDGRDDHGLSAQSPVTRDGGANLDGPPDGRRAGGVRVDDVQGNHRLAVGVRTRVRIAAGPRDRTLKEAWR
jgi:hypothetical protein